MDENNEPDNQDSGIKFNEWRPQTGSPAPETPKIILWVIKYSGGYIKNEKQASYALLVFAVLAIIISLFLFFGGSNKGPLYEEDIMGPNGLPVRGI